MSRAGAIRTLLDGPEAMTRDMVRDWLSEPGHAPVTDLPREAYRAQVSAWAEELAMSGGTAMGYPAEFGGLGDVRGSIAGFETLAFGDLSLLVKCGVQFGLFGGAVLQLGTMRHHERYLTAIARLELPGGFAMTESDHGSNVQALETTATYDAATEEFVVHTPTPGARKDYIGNAARDGRLAVVFAQLVTGGEPRGVHALLVPLRDADGAVLPGVTIEDCGAKLGLEGVDNGRIAFDHVRVGRDALLDRYATVQPDGAYASPIENPAKRFFVMLGTLIQGRVSVCGAAITTSKSALDIAIRHALERRQFGPPGGAEALLLDYRTHQRRLLPALATTYGLHFAQARLVDRLHTAFCTEVPDRSRRELETLAAGLKAVASAHATTTIQTCREACGGFGYLQESRLPALMADAEIFTTFEGDNTVLLQLAAKNLLTGYRDQLGELDPLGLASFFAGQVIGTIAERTAVRKVLGELACDLLPGRDDGRPLRDRAEQRETAALAPGAPAAGRRAAAEGRPRRGPRPVRRAARLPGPRRRGRARVGRPRRARGLRGGGRRRPRARPALQPLRAEPRRGGARLLPGARPPDRGTVEGGRPDGQRALRRAAARRGAAGRGVRRAGDERRARRGYAMSSVRSSCESSGSRNS